MIFDPFQDKPFNITVIQVYAPTTDAKENEIKQLYKDIRDLIELTPKTDALFIIGDWNARVGNQEIPEVIDKFGFWSTNETGKRLTVLSREHNGHNKHLLQITQEITLHMDITRWSTLKSDGLYSLQPKLEKLYTSAKTRPGADCGSDHELLIAKF